MCNQWRIYWPAMLMVVRFKCITIYLNLPHLQLVGSFKEYWICIGIIKRLRRVRPVLKNSLNLLGAGTDQNVGIYWSNHKPAISRLHESHAEFHTAGKLGDVKWRLAFRPLRSIVEECHEKMNHSNNDVRGLNDWLQLIYFTLAFSQ